MLIIFSAQFNGIEYSHGWVTTTTLFILPN